MNLKSMAATLMALGMLMQLPVFSQAPTPFGATPNERQIEWYHRERQVFLHFGMNTMTDIEWGTGDENPSLFNPPAVDCMQWMESIAKAGFSAAILVAKHHDGFCLWPSEFTSHDVASSPWKGGKGDVVKDFVDACRHWNVKSGIYLSCGDFHHEELLGDDYPDFYMNQTREIVQNYGTIWEMWWDGANSNIKKEDFIRYADTIHHYQPNCAIWSDAAGKEVTAEMRWNGNEDGINGDPCWATMDANWSNREEGTRGGRVYSPAEADVSIRPGWFYHDTENNRIKSVSELFDIYFQSVGRNGGLLLNVPPAKNGRLYEVDIGRIDTLNHWVYGTFLTNLAAGAQVTALHTRGPDHSPANLVDSLENTYFATSDAFFTDTILFELGSAKTFDVVMLREVIELGHRTTRWSVDAYYNNTWNTIVANKQTVGYKWLQKFNRVTADQVRLRITAGQACVALNTFGLYKQQAIAPPDPVTIKSHPRNMPAAKKCAKLVPGKRIVIPAEFVNTDVTVDILDLKGRRVQRMMVKRNAVAGLKSPRLSGSGLYVIKWSTKDKILVQKFLNVTR